MKKFILFLIVFSYYNTLTPHSTPKKYYSSDVTINKAFIDKLDKKILVDKSFKFISTWESFESKPYKCPSGKLTIGYGTRLYDSIYPVEWTKHKAEEITKEKISKLIDKLDTLISRNLTEEQKISLISISYNIGFYAFKKSTLLKTIKNQESLKNNTSIEKQFKRWNKVRDTSTGDKKELLGLTKRRNSEVHLWNT